jgi:DNA-directed RNA polymerase specialized sigma24 family protein
VRIVAGCSMPSNKPFWIASGSGQAAFPDRLVRAGYDLKDRVRRFATQLLGHDSDAPELIERAIQHVASRRDPQFIEAHPNPGGLLYTKVRELILREKRQNSRFIYYSASGIDDRFGSSGDELIQNIDAKRSLSRMEAKLTPDEQELLSLLLLDYNVAEIARTLGISRNAAYKRRRKLFAKAKKLLDR